MLNLTSQTRQSVRPARPAAAAHAEPTLNGRRWRVGPAPIRTPILRYLAALLVVLVAFAIRLVAQPLIGDASRLMIFLPALLAAAWLGGLRPAIFALALSCLLGLYSFVPPYGTLRLHSTADAAGTLLFIVAGLGVITALHLQRRASASALAAQARTTQEASRRHSAEASLHDAREELSLLIDAVADHAILLVDRRGNIMSWNTGAQRLTGWTAPEVLGKPCTLLSPPEAVCAGDPGRVLEVALRTGVHHDVGPRLRKDGSTFIAEVSIFPIHDAAGSLRGFAKVTHDITELVRAEREIRELNESLERRVRDRTAELQEANDQLEAFARSVSHDLRAPLRSMWGFAAALLDDHADALGEEGRDYAQRIVAAARRMDTLITDLLELSRLSRADVQTAPVALGDALADARITIQAQLDASGAELEVAAGLPTVLAQRQILVQVLANLLDNAAKFVAPGVRPRIAVRARPAADPRFARIEVDDNGIGIDPADAERIFQPFERLHGEEAYPGSGIGLAIAKTGVERMGGTIGVEPAPTSPAAPSGGSRFWVEIPLAETTP